MNTENRKNTPWIILLTFAGFILFFFIELKYFGEIRQWIVVNAAVGHLGISHFITYVIVGLPVLLALMIMHRPGKLLESLGLSGGILRAIVIAGICTLPMFIGYAIVFDWNPEVNATRIIAGVICAGLFEEIYFRGFLFGQLYRYTKLGFVPSILISAFLFAAVHLSQSQDPGTIFGIFMITFAGAIFFAWTYIEWENNLWVPVFLHMFMNLSWMLFSAGENALGGFFSNLFRILTIAFVIAGTIRYKKKKGLKFHVNRDTLWIKPD